MKNMKKRILILLTAMVISLTALMSNVYASIPINAVDNIYKEGIYRLNDYDDHSYNFEFRFVTPNKKCSIIILDENNDTIYKSGECLENCNAGIITNKNTIIVITNGEVAFYFKKQK
ncbi:Uncharacterised protein [uncultured Clostridium sp.]|uniref:hypothetical protein n=1 Tax=uncultured Clostridium sp. TaxID=59620 RepID=UPI00082109B0|nr:hypothetical protein [uncultured Clostridium sp.]SCJ99812.1 Uncharacterised protein [uncultured Clostridium sp.]